MAFDYHLEKKNKIRVNVEPTRRKAFMKQTLYCQADDRPMLERAYIFCRTSVK